MQQVSFLRKDVYHAHCNPTAIDEDDTQFSSQVEKHVSENLSSVVLLTAMRGLVMYTCSELNAMQINTLFGGVLATISKIEFKSDLTESYPLDN